MTPTRPAARGALSAVAAFLMWGLFPLYWKQVASVPALEIVAHRTAWAFLFIAAWVSWRGGWRDAGRAVASRRTLLVLVTGAVLIALNWLLYIWAVTHAHVMEASLGYYVNPLVNVLLGLFVLRERLGRAQGIAVALAATGVAVLTLGYGRFPWIALALACTFGLYGLVRKTVAADAVTGLLCETAILAPLAAGYLLVLARRGTGAFGTDARASAVLLLGGGVTALPLALFAYGARALPLSTLGFIQYLSPTLQFLCAVAIYGEPFTKAHAVTFACIWTALALLTWDAHKRLRRAGAALAPETP